MSIYTKIAKKVIKASKKSKRASDEEALVSYKRVHRKSKSAIVKEFIELLKEHSQDKEKSTASIILALSGIVLAITALVTLIKNLSGSSVRSSVDFSAIAQGTVTSDFGWRNHPISGSRVFHQGVDIAGKEGSDIRSYASGEVVYAGSQRDAKGELSGYGHYITIKHDDGTYTRYAHLQSLPSLKVGDKVQKGQVIGAMGHTGSATGTHLHFELRTANDFSREHAVNPLVTNPASVITAQAIPGTLSIPDTTAGQRRMKAHNNYGNVVYSEDINTFIRSLQGVHGTPMTQQNGQRFATFSDPAYGILAIAQRAQSYKSWNGYKYWKSWNQNASQKLPQEVFAPGTLSIAKYVSIYEPYGDGSNNPEARANAIAQTINHYGGNVTITSELNPNLRAHFYGLILVTLKHEGGTSISSTFLEDLYLAYIHKSPVPTVEYYRARKYNPPEHEGYSEVRTIVSQRTYNQVTPFI